MANPWSFVTPHLCTFAYKSSELGGGGVTQRGREREGEGGEDPPPWSPLRYGINVG
jgi:hypothetical protein